jgi:hypothetical protein
MWIISDSYHEKKMWSSKILKHMWRFDLRDWDFHQTGRFTVTFMGKPMGLCIPISGDDFKTHFSVSNGFSFRKETEMVTQEKTCCHLQNRWTS